jgi:hypothetical protein
MLRRVLLSVPVSACVLGLLLVGGPAGARTGSPASSARPGHPARAVAAARAVLLHLRIGHPNPNQPVPGSTVRVGGVTKQLSDNWSGYADTNASGNVYSAVSGKWVQPTVSCPTKEDQIVVTWVGIDGWNSGTVEQGGTLAQCFLGTAHYYTWWEMYPTNFIQIVGSTVQPKDVISASVVRSGTSYTIKVTDATTPANSFTTTQTCTASGGCPNASAEWIAESPSGRRGYYPLADFHTWRLSSATVKSGSKSGVITTFPDIQISIIDSSGTYALAQPGALNTTGNSFADTWKNSY